MRILLCAQLSTFLSPPSLLLQNTQHFSSVEQKAHSRRAGLSWGLLFLFFLIIIIIILTPAGFSFCRRVTLRSPFPPRAGSHPVPWLLVQIHLLNGDVTLQREINHCGVLRSVWVYPPLGTVSIYMDR